MSRHVVFLRAINVGGHRVAMAELRGLFEELELSDVETHGASGNVVFGASESSPDLERRIGEHLERALGYPVAAFVRTLDRLREIVETVPFDPAPADEETKLYVTFVHDPLDEERRAALAELCSEVDELVARDREIYWRRRLDAGESIPTSAIESTLGVEATRRTLSAVRKIVTRFG